MLVGNMCLQRKMIVCINTQDNKVASSKLPMRYNKEVKHDTESVDWVNENMM